MLSGPFNLSYLRFCLDDSLIRGKNILIKPYWNNDPSHRSSLRGGFLKFIYIMTIILMMRLLIVSLLTDNEVDARL